MFEERRRFKESNIFFKSDSRKAIDVAISAIRLHRMELENYIALHPEFRYALDSISIEKEAPLIVQLMVRFTEIFDIGPMAAVAGVLADLAVQAILGEGARKAIVENGGEISAFSDEPFNVSLYLGENVLSNRMGFQVSPSDCPIGIATSSATIGHAISFGEADAVTVFADNAGLADAAATAFCNSVIGDDEEGSINKGLQYADKFRTIIRGVFIVRGKYMGTMGKIPEFIDIKKDSVKPEKIFSD